jgi:hypothetical protein
MINRQEASSHANSRGHGLQCKSQAGNGKLGNEVSVFTSYPNLYVRLASQSSRVRSDGVEVSIQEQYRGRFPARL